MLFRNMSFSRMQGNILVKDMSWTHQCLNMKEVYSFMTSENNKIMIQYHMPKKEMNP